MSTAHAVNQIEYPESDGNPMGETDLHRYWMIRILDILQHRYRNDRVYAASDLLVYYDEGDPRRFVVPDNFIVLDCAPTPRRTFMIWEEQRVPDVVFEVTSKSTRTQDEVTKPRIYEELGVKEYFLYDPSGEYLRPSLRGFRLVDSMLTEVTGKDGRLKCQTLGVSLWLNADALVLTDATTGETLLTEAEAQEHAKDQALRTLDQERQTRKAAEARIRELEEKIRRLEQGTND